MAMSRAKIIKSVWREFTLVQALFVIFIGRKPATEMEQRSCGIEVSTAETTIRKCLHSSLDLFLIFYRAKARRGDGAAEPRNRGQHGGVNQSKVFTFPLKGIIQYIVPFPYPRSDMAILLLYYGAIWLFFYKLRGNPPVSF